MKPLRTGTPPAPKWDVADLVKNLGYDRMKAKQILKEYCEANHGGYGPVEKHLILDFIEQKQRAEREREARYQSDLANVEALSVLKEQVKTLREQVRTLREICDGTAEDARKARAKSNVANTVAIISVIVAILALALSHLPV